MKNKLFNALLTVGALFASMGLAYADDDLSPIPKVSDEWRFAVAPYAWAPGATATISNDGKLIKSASMSIGNVLSNLKSVGMIAGEGHYGKWGFLADFATATVQQKGSFTYTPPNSNSRYSAGDKGTMQATLATGAATYTVLNNKDVYLDALVGARWMSITTTLELVENGGANEKIGYSVPLHTVDAVAGFKGRYRIMDSSWYIPFYADVGTGGGSHNMTWQGALGIGMAISKSMDFSVSYRALGFDLNGGSGSSTLAKGTFKGPQLTGSMNF